MPGFLRARTIVVVGLLCVAAGPLSAQGGFTPGKRTLFSLDLKGTEVGELPKGIKLLKGSLTVADKDGEHMMMTAEQTEFLVSFSETLPADFTVEIDIIPRACNCLPADLMFEGTISRSRSASSAEIEWMKGKLSVIGGGQHVQEPMSQDLYEALAGNLTEIGASFDGTKFTIVTNGKTLFTDPSRKFVRGRSIRFTVVGQDEHENAMYIARLRIATNSPPPPPKPGA